MLSKMSKENLEMLSYAKIAELYLKENKNIANEIEEQVREHYDIMVDKKKKKVDKKTEKEVKE